MRKMLITETDFVKVLMGNVYAYSPWYDPDGPEVILAKARDAFRGMCDEDGKAKGFYHMMIPISEIPDMLSNVLMGIPEYRDNMLSYSDACIETISDDFKEMALYDIMWDEFFDDVKSIRVD